MASDSSKQKKEGAGKSKATKPSLNMNELRELADLVNENGFTDFEFENEKIRVRLSKNLVSTVQQVAQPQLAPVQQADVQSTSKAEILSDSDSAETEDIDDGLHKITSPIVGTFYSAPAPDKAAFAKIGDKVSAESVVCIVEAMKLMNEIQAETTGEIVKIYVENAQPVEYGQALFGIKQ